LVLNVEVLAMVRISFVASTGYGFTVY